MKISELMIPDPITISSDASIEKALETLKDNAIRHLPVVGKGNRFAGLLTLADIKQGLIPAMLTDLRLTDLMIHEPITVGPDEEIEVAAQLIYKHKISGLPVLSRGKLVGILTESDIFRAFIDMMGLLTATSRIDVVVGEDPAGINTVVQIINEGGGDIISVGMTPRRATDRVYYFRLASCKTTPIRQALESAGFRVISAID